MAWRLQPTAGMLVPSRLARGQCLPQRSLCDLFSVSFTDGLLSISNVRLMWLLMPLLISLLVIVCLLMILAILMQRPKNEGLGAAFGGGLTDNLFGAQTTTVLTKFTVWMGGIFFALTLLISVLQVRATAGPTAIQKQLLKSPSPASSPAK